MTRGEFQLTVRQSQLLKEAHRRWMMRRPEDRYLKRSGVAAKCITEAWTGLGSATHYKPVFDAGLMEPVHGPHPGNSIWWKLTEKGVLAMILLDWTEGESHEEEIG